MRPTIWQLLYYLSKDQSCARRSALILDRFAQVYPGYCVHFDLPFLQKTIFSGDQGFPYPVEDYRGSQMVLVGVYGHPDKPDPGL